LLNSDQTRAVAAIEKTEGSVLLHGITGSGKTAVYIESARRVVATGKSVIVLVPEIALTSQLIAEFSHHFDSLLVTHSRQTEAERHIAWKRALESTEPTVVIGPRSALFTPLKNVGLIIIDEAHEPSFKQEQSPRYSALRAARILAKEHHATLVMGSATPSISDYYVATETHAPIIQLRERARKNAVKPTITVVDMTQKSSFKTHRFLSNTLLSTVEATLAAKKQVLIFHNRRGTAAMTLCTNCGWTATDPDTGLPLTLHADRHLLQSHLTGKTWPVPTSCPACGGVDIIHKGIGTKLIETELARLFPQATIARFDGDTHEDNSVDKRYKELYDGSIDIIIGTQVVAKGLDLPHLRTVGIVQADSGLALPDYGASERVFQLLTQAIGRVGRSEHETTVIVQSYQPDHPAVRYGITQDFEQFYTHELAVRKRTHFPPFCFLLKLTCIYKSEAAAVKNARIVANDLTSTYGAAITILGPTPAFYERVSDTYRWQIVVKSTRRQALVAALARVPNNGHWQTELDPVSLL
jgi:primosomal protein N' (replication factor Y)